MVQVSPGIQINEIDLTNIVAQASTTEGAFAGVFRWGPVEKRILIDSEKQLATRFGTPTNLNPETWFTAANFLAYGNKLYISRAADTTGNTVARSFAGQVATVNSPTLTLANSTVGNTNLVSVGMKVFFSNSSAVPVGAVVLSVNSTTVTLDKAATANANAVGVVFREDITFTSAALQSDLNYTVENISDWDNQVVKNDDHYASRELNGQTFDVAALYVARCPGEMGDSLRVSVCDAPTQFRSNTNLAVNAQINSTASLLTGVVGSNVLTVTIAPVDTANATNVTAANTHAGAVRALLSVGDLIEIGNTRVGFQTLSVAAISNVAVASNTYSFTITCDDRVKLSSNTSNPYLARFWEFYNAVDVAPGQSTYVANFGNTAANDELHVVVVDEDGKFSGSPGTVLEVFPAVSRATDAKSSDGATIYYKDVINQRSQYIWFANDRTTARSNTANFVTSSNATVPLSMDMVGGADGKNEATVAFGTLAFAWDLFQSEEDIDISLVLQGKARGESVSHFSQLANYLIDNIAEKRKDCVVFISPDYNDVIFNVNEEVVDVVDFANACRSTSYAMMDCNYKYQYDKYNDVYRWIPLNGDIAGLCARTDETNDAWWSPAGYNRGTIKNIVKLAWNPRKAERDILYKASVNPVISQPGQGTVLYGDKTLLKKDSAFSRINVRRLFLVLERSIAKAAKYMLFEFNDDTTRAAFRNMVNPFLREVKGRRGVYEFKVVCDGSNNTPEVIDNNQFVGAIYVKPSRSINFIRLDFVAVRTGVDFAEVTL